MTDPKEVYQIHGGSTMSPWAHTDAEVAVQFTDAERADKNFEIVYTAREVFDDGFSRDIICYRVSNPAYDPKHSRRDPNPPPQTLAHLRYF